MIGQIDDVTHMSSSSMTPASAPAARSAASLRVKQVIHAAKHTYFRQRHRDDLDLSGHVTLPARCGLKAARDDFLLMGRERLGSLQLGCSPYLREWRAVQHLAECSHG